jgi:hypothetical protein
VPDDPLTAAWWSARWDVEPPGMPVRPPGRHRAEGLSGPPRHYLAIVVLLAGTASLPLVTAIVTGPNSTGDTAFADASPFLAPPSGGPVVVLPPASPSAGQPPEAVARHAPAMQDAQPGPRADDPQPGPRAAHRPTAPYRPSAESVRWNAPSPSPPTTGVEREQPRTYGRPCPVRLPWASPSPASTRSPVPSPAPTPDATPTPAGSGSPDPSGTPEPTPSPTLDPSLTPTSPGPLPS